MRNLLLAAAVLAARPAAAAVYAIDAVHSGVGFKIRHVRTRVPGRFTAFKGTIGYEPGKPESWSVEASIDPASINTDNPKRDAHLRGDDFFDTARCPEMSFKSVKVTDVSGDRAKLHGLLTMRCKTVPVVLDLEVGGLGADPWGNSKAGFSATGRIVRKDFDMVWNKALDKGGVILGEEVEVSLEIEADELKAPAAKDAPKAAAKPEPAKK